MRARPQAWRSWSFVALLAGDVVGCGSGTTGTSADGTASASAVTPPPSTAPSATAPDRHGQVADTPWAEVERWIALHEICWAAPFANGRAFVTRCDGTEHRTTLPKADSLKKAVDAADPKHDTIGYTTNYETHREIPWTAAAALFPTGTVYEIEVNQNFRAFLETSSGARYATVVASDDELTRLVKASPRPMIVKLFRVEELPWKRALTLFAARHVVSASRVHIGRVFFGDDAGRDYLTIPPNDDALSEARAFAPNASWTVE